MGTDLIKGALAGLVATWALERVTTYLNEREDPGARQREDAVRQGEAPFMVAAEKMSELIGLRISEQQQQRLGMAYHWDRGLERGRSTQRSGRGSARSSGVRGLASASCSSSSSTRR